MSSEVIDIIYNSINPEGYSGFEGLVKELLESLTGFSFNLASSGYQAGRDMSSRTINGTVIAVECKRYGQNNELNDRELLGEISQIKRDIPFLDLWVLATSQKVDSQLYESLKQEAYSKGIVFEAISADDFYPSSLDILCSYSPKIVFNFIEDNVSQEEKEILHKKFKGIKNKENYKKTIKKLKRKFEPAYIGFDQFRKVQNKKLKKYFNHENKSRSLFGQILNVEEVKEKLVPRKDAWKEIDNWYSEWKENKNFFILLGEEGDGKTWAVASWIAKNIKDKNDFPPVIFMSSKNITSKEPKEILSNAFNRTHKRDKSFWSKKIDNWFHNSTENKPLLLIIIDGINERRSNSYWREIIENFSDNTFKNKIGLIVTSRSAYWERYFNDLNYIDCKKYKIKPYDDSELEYALKLNNINMDEISNNLLPMIKKPRYFDLMIKHHEKLNDSGEITPARIVYEDWKDRYNRKNNIELDNESFQGLIKKLAQEYKSDNNLSSGEIKDLLPGNISDIHGQLNELITGGILTGKEYEYHVDKEMLGLGFGLLLVDEVKKTKEDSIDVLEKLLKPNAGLDLTAEICEKAIVHAFTTDVSKEIKVNLLYVWINSQNVSSNTEANFGAYFPKNKKVYLGLAELIWKYDHNNPWAQELMKDTFLKWEKELIDEEIINTFEKWLGYININGFVFQRKKDNNRISELNKSIKERIGKDISEGSFMYGNYKLTIIKEDGLLRLGRFALAIISHLPRKYFIRAIAIGSLSEAIMGYTDKYKLFSWVLKTSSTSVFELVKKEINNLLKIDTKVAKKAAYRLLSYEDSKKANELKEEFPNDLFPESSLKKKYNEDPCASFKQWKRNNLEKCLCRDDLKIMYKIRNLNKFCIEPDLKIPDKFKNKLPKLLDKIDVKKIRVNRFVSEEDLRIEDIESVFYLFLPELFADLMKSLASDIIFREKEALFQLSISLLNHYLIFDEEQFNVILKIWQKLHKKQNNLNKKEKDAEMFLFRLVLFNADSKQQLNYLTKRAEDFYDLINYKPKFKKVKNWDRFLNDLSKTEQPEKLKRMLWFISENHKEIPIYVLNKLVEFIDHDYTEIRGILFEISYKNKLEKVSNKMLNKDWKWDSSNSIRENHWGSLLLCEATEIPYSKINKRIDPSFLAYAVSCRGYKKNDLKSLINDIQLTKDIKEFNITQKIPKIEVMCNRSEKENTIERYRLGRDLNSNNVNIRDINASWGGKNQEINDIDLILDHKAIEKKENQQIEFINDLIEKQKQNGNTLFIKRIDDNLFNKMIKRHPKIINKWLKPVFENKSNYKKKIILNKSFYVAICKSLLKIAPEKGLKLYRILKSISGVVYFNDQNTGISLLDYYLFKSDKDKVEEEWFNYLNQCKTDDDLLTLVLLLESEEANKWLKNVINEGLESQVLFNKVRAITLLGFSDCKEAPNILKKYINEEAETWAGKVAQTSLFRFNRNKYAQYWFDKFISKKNKVNVWRSFRLFLQCVDKRFWKWDYDNEINKEEDYTKYNFLQDNISKIKNKIKKNQKDYKKKFLNYKVLNRQVWPWM